MELDWHQIPFKSVVGELTHTITWSCNMRRPLRMCIFLLPLRSFRISRTDRPCDASPPRVTDGGVTGSYLCFYVPLYNFRFVKFQKMPGFSHFKAIGKGNFVHLFLAWPWAVAKKWNQDKKKKKKKKKKPQSQYFSEDASFEAEKGHMTLNFSGST